MGRFGCFVGETMMEAHEFNHLQILRFTQNDRGYSNFPKGQVGLLTTAQVETEVMIWATKPALIRVTLAFTGAKRHLDMCLRLR